MPLNKLENFIKNTDGRTLYVNPNDLNATDSISNQGTSLTEPFRTIQRALVEAARFSYVRGNDNDLIERTTILVYPGEHVIDNRPGYGINVINGSPVAVEPSGEITDPFAAFNLTSDSNFDIESPNNVLHRFNSIYGGCIVPRGTSIVGMDLRKTKIRPLYVPNPTDPAVGKSAIFRITGTCYFWQFTIFDGKENGFVYTDDKDFSESNRSTPTFSHSKLTAFEYADGVNPAVAEGYDLTDLQIYYSKLTNAYNEASGRPIDEKFPVDSEGFAPQRPEFEIVGAFATDPVSITRIISGDGFTPDTIVTVDTAFPHELSADTPIKIRGVAVDDYNISTKVSSILSPTRFQYLLPFVRPNLPAEPSVSSATVTVETDTVTGASPYIFNVSMRSVWGINGMHADGAKATGFRSMVVAQFTAISLQKDDRAFVKYNQPARRYDGINYKTVRGAELSSRSSSTNTATVYHLDPEAIYRPGWDTTHIKMSNDAVIQIVSVFAIGFNQHFGAFGGADASITNSNSNFGQFALLANGFKNDAFKKDDQGFISSIITPNNAYNPETNEVETVDYVNLDLQKTYDVGYPDHLYLKAYTNKEDKPPAISQGFRIGGNYNEKLFQPTPESVAQGVAAPSATVYMTDVAVNDDNNRGQGNFIARKSYNVLSGPINNTLKLPLHGLVNGEKIRIFSATGDLPENVDRGELYYANVVDFENIRLSTSEANARNNIFLEIYGGTQLRIESRVNDKEPGDFGHPVQYDEVNSNWFVYCNFNNQIFQYILNNVDAGEVTTEAGDDFVSVYKRTPDNRSLDDKLYRVRYVVPKESRNAKPPTPGYIIQDSSTTGARNNDDFILDDININDYEYNRNLRYIVNAALFTNNNPPGVVGEVEVRSERPHNLSVGDKINMIGIQSTDNPTALQTRGYNGEFRVTQIINSRVFRYNVRDVSGFLRTPGTFSNNTNDRNILLPRFERKDNQVNAFVYRIEEIVPFTEGIRDGIYHLFLVNGSNKVSETFGDRNYNQPIEDLYPQLDPDNVNDNPEATKSFANRAPLGKVTIDEQQNSITRETIDKLYLSGNRGSIVEIDDSTADTNGYYTSTLTFDREHEYNSVYNYTVLRGGSGYAVGDGKYYNVKLLSNFGAEWKGATATVTISSQVVSDLVIDDPGSGYNANETLIVDPDTLGGGTGAEVDIDVNSIEQNIDTIVQITGGGSPFPDTYSYITEVTSSETIGIARSTGSLEIIPGMYAYPTDSGTVVSTYSYDAIEKVSTFTSVGNAGFGLQRGNSIVIFGDEGDYLGKFYVKNLPTPNVLEVATGFDLEATGQTVRLIGKAGFEDNDASTGSTGENVGVRGTEIFDLGTFYLNENSGSKNVLKIRAKDGGNLNISEKLFLGRYLKIGNEIIRVASDVVTGVPENEVKVIRGALGTNVINHPANTKIKAIFPLPVELRRPSILRASGHTFEYLGYGPGNYSTSLPQLQVRQLPDEETYLVQAQELSCGQVVYTGMSDNGDFYIGNLKYSATSGTQITFDVPVPTVAGQEASSNSVVFDEVVINRRLFVIGGETNEILSQFDGPVKFTQPVTIQSRLSVSDSINTNTLSVNSTQNSTDQSNGALIVRGGAGIGNDLWVGGNIYVNTDPNNPDRHGDIYTNYYDQFPGTADSQEITLFPSNTNPDYPIRIGSDTGKVLFETDILGIGQGGREDIDNSSGGVEIDGSLVVRDAVIAREFRGDGIGQPGSVIMWGGPVSNVPDGYILCDGRQLSKSAQDSKYLRLFGAIGYTHGGSGDNFNVPDLRGQFIAGAGGAYGVADTGGANSITLVTEELPAHNHPISTEDTSHNHPSSVSVSPNTAPHNHPGSSAPNGLHDHNGTVDSNGNHFHSGSVDSNGLHAHQASSGQAGGHSHNTTVSQVGNHRHDNPAQANRTRTEQAGEHRHPASSGNQGSHNHSGNANDAGGHNHAASTANTPNHTHGGETGDAGGHSHGGETSNDGSHSHSYDSVQGGETEAGNGDDGGAREGDRTSNDGSHRHNITTNTNGNHRHNIATNANGGHRHPVSVSPGGTHRHTLSINQNGGHNHPVSTTPNGNHSHFLTMTPNGAHSHTVQNSTQPDHQHPVSIVQNGNHNHTFSSAPAGAHQHTFNTTNNGTHNHDISTGVVDAPTNHGHASSVSVGTRNITHTHNIGNTGGGAAHENRPPYYALCFIIQYR